MRSTTVTMVASQSQDTETRSHEVHTSVDTSVTSPPEKDRDAQTITEGDGDAEGENAKGKGVNELSEKDEMALEEERDEWEHDPANPRKWSNAKKWRMVAIVRSTSLYLVLLSGSLFVM